MSGLVRRRQVKRERSLFTCHADSCLRDGAPIAGDNHPPSEATMNLPHHSTVFRTLQTCSTSNTKAAVAFDVIVKKKASFVPSRLNSTAPPTPPPLLWKPRRRRARNRFLNMKRAAVLSAAAALYPPGCRCSSLFFASTEWETRRASAAWSLLRSIVSRVCTSWNAHLWINHSWREREREREHKQGIAAETSNITPSPPPAATLRGFFT